MAGAGSKARSAISREYLLEAAVSKHKTKRVDMSLIQPPKWQAAGTDKAIEIIGGDGDYPALE